MMPALPFLPAEPLQGGATSLSLAAGNGHEAVVRLLLDNKAEANLTDQVHCSYRPGANMASKPFANSPIPWMAVSCAVRTFCLKCS
jgi:ankyrin repeat protein